MKVSCQIIRDLLPLYHDDVCSGDTKELVKLHLNECRDCSGELEKMSMNMIPPINKDDSKDEAIVKNIARGWIARRKRSFIKGIIIAAAAFIILMVAYNFLFIWPIVSISDEPETIDANRLSDGSLAFEIVFNNTPDVITSRIGEDGNYYIECYDTIIRMNDGQNKSYHTVNLNDEEISDHMVIYLGTGADKKIIWDGLNELPKASDEEEKMFSALKEEGCYMTDMMQP